jgi:hypothetical protein
MAKTCAGYHQNKTRRFMSRQEIADSMSEGKPKVDPPEPQAEPDDDAPIPDRFEKKPPPKNRRCEVCNCKLSIYNKGTRCSPCRDIKDRAEWIKRQQQ